MTVHCRSKRSRNRTPMTSAPVGFSHDNCWREAEKRYPVPEKPRVEFSFQLARETRCKLLVSFLSALKIRLQSLPDHWYPPMGNCCSSSATVPSEPQPPPVTGLRSSAPAPLQPNVKDVSLIPSSSRPPSRPRGHSSVSQHESTRRGGRSSQDLTPRSRTKSAPQPSQTFKSSSPQDSRPRVRSVVQSKRSSRSDSRHKGLGEAH